MKFNIDRNNYVVKRIRAKRPCSHFICDNLSSLISVEKASRHNQRATFVALLLYIVLKDKKYF